MANDYQGHKGFFAKCYAAYITSGSGVKIERKIKPYYKRNNITIYNADCLEVMPQLEPGFDAIIADLPYGTTACEWDEIIPLEPLWENYKRLVKARGAVALFGSQPFTSMLVMSNLEWFKYEWVWKKIKPTGFQMAKYRPLKEHENILIFSDSPSTNTNRESMMFNPQGIIKLKRLIKRTQKGLASTGGGDTTGSYIGEFSNYPQSIISFNRSIIKTLHPTQKPVALMAYLVRTYTNPGDLVLDNAMGSGTTLVAAQNEGRRAVGIDISEEYCKIAVERLRQPSFWSIPDEPKEVAGEQLDLWK